MKKFRIRELETVKTTAALYACWQCPWVCPPIDEVIIIRG